MSELMLDVGQANELKFAFRRANYSNDEIKQLCEGDMFTQVREVLLGRARIVPIEIEMKATVQAVRNTLIVLPSLTLSERLAAGNYDSSNGNINEKRFSHDPTTVGEWEWDLVGYDYIISSEDAKAAAEVDGWVVAKWEHELALGAAFPDLQRKNPIIAIGSVCVVSGNRYVLVLWRGRGGRGVSLRHWGGGWFPHCRFLRVRKIQVSNA